MARTKEWKALLAAAAVFLACFYMPVGQARFDGAVLEGLHLVHAYAREHVVLCLVPALFIAGGMAVFLSQAAVIRRLGPEAPKAAAYGIASISGAVLAVCSCTVLPLFAGIYRMGAGLGPATAFLYSGPAINILAIVLTARVLGFELGVARAVGAIGLSVIIGGLMQAIFGAEEQAQRAPAALPASGEARPLGQQAALFAVMTAVLVFANWAEPEGAAGFVRTVYAYKWALTAAAAGLLGFMLTRWFGARRGHVAGVAVIVAAGAWAAPGRPILPFALGTAGLVFITTHGSEELRAWRGQTWGLAKQILPLLLAGVFIAGLLLGRPGGEGLVPSDWIAAAVGGNSLRANLCAAAAGALMYFATLTEIPILEGLLGNGMGQGPALALLLAGPALSLPNLLVLHSVLGAKKTAVFAALVVIAATGGGMAFGAIMA